jgi:hypothetical protein
MPQGIGYEGLFEPINKKRKRKISDKIAFLIRGEGRKPNQAGAIAWNMARRKNR